MRHLTTGSSLRLTLCGKPVNRVQHVKSLHLQEDGNKTPETEWNCHWCVFFCTSGSLSELDSVSLAPATAPLSVCGESECGTATKVPSSLTWDFSVILSIPEGHKTHLFFKMVYCVKWFVLKMRWDFVWQYAHLSNVLTWGETRSRHVRK